jgi:hypothetical protein
MEKLGGDVQISSGTGKGTAVEVIVPIASP